MRTIDRCIFGAIAVGIWMLIAIITLHPQAALSQNAALNNLIALASDQLNKLDCTLSGTSSSDGAITGDIRCHL
jgi:hypothetical protein